MGREGESVQRDVICVETQRRDGKKIRQENYLRLCGQIVSLNLLSLAIKSLHSNTYDPFSWFIRIDGMRWHVETFCRIPTYSRDLVHTSTLITQYTAINNVSFENHLSYPVLQRTILQAFSSVYFHVYSYIFKTMNRCNFRNDTLKMQLIFSSNYITELIAAGFFPGNSGHSMAKERTAQLCQHIATGNEQSGRSTLPKLCVTECMQTTLSSS